MTDIAAKMLESHQALVARKRTTLEIRTKKKRRMRGRKKGMN
jgi:hypothetical protein